MTLRQGGYYSLRPKLVKGGYINEHTGALPRPFSQEALDALNHVQQTKWRINRRVLDVVAECIDGGLSVAGLPTPNDIPAPARLPDHEFEALEKSEKARIKRRNQSIHDANAAMRAQRTEVYRRVGLAKRLSRFPVMWFPHDADFRGRIYPLPQDLTPQGDSLSKGLLEFADPQPLGERGGYWLAVAFANAMGHDKLPLDERFRWTVDNRDCVMATAGDPFSMTEWWGAEGVDSPWEALALAFELDSAWAHGGNDYLSHVPVRLDATCSGIQHLAALMRDRSSGQSVNLIPTGKREDIYGDVSAAAKTIVSKDAAAGNDVHRLWLRERRPRGARGGARRAFVRVRDRARAQGRERGVLAMKTYAVRMVGEPDVGLFEAPSPMHAAAQAAGCHWTQVGLPIWGQDWCRLKQRYGIKCFMPLDDSGRQWVVTEHRVTSPPASP
jgi:DNA-directed RNA polymerase